jgi:hypothetical protein
MYGYEELLQAETDPLQPAVAGARKRLEVATSSLFGSFRGNGWRTVLRWWFGNLGDEVKGALITYAHSNDHCSAAEKKFQVRAANQFLDLHPGINIPVRVGIKVFEGSIVGGLKINAAKQAKIKDIICNNVNRATLEEDEENIRCERALVWLKLRRRQRTRLCG